MRGLNKITDKIKKTEDLLWQLIYPPRCVICEKLIAMDKGVCDECRKKLPYVGNIYCMKCGKPVENEDEYCADCMKKNHYFTRGVSLWTYSRLVKKSLYRFKYSNKRYYAKFYAKEILNRYGKLIKEWNVEKIVPIPLYKTKERKRGYNQAQILAKELSALTGVELGDKIVLRIRNTIPQKKLNDKERHKNLKGAFKINKNMVKSKKILLIDDIFTTGSTVDEVARVFVDSGVCEVYVITLCIGRGF